MAAVLLVLSLASCSDPLKSTKEEAEIVCKIGDYEIPYEIYRYFVLSYKDTIPEGTEITEDIEKQIKYKRECKQSKCHIKP